MEKHELTGEELLSAIEHMLEEGFVRVDKRMDSIEGKIERLEGRMGSVEHRMDSMKHQIDSMEHRMDSMGKIVLSIQELSQDTLETLNTFASDTEKRLTAIEVVLPTLATKEYVRDTLDEKLGLVIGRQNRKTEALIEQLVSEKSLHRQAADRILAMPPSFESL